MSNYFPLETIGLILIIRSFKTYESKAKNTFKRITVGFPSLCVSDLNEVSIEMRHLLIPVACLGH